MSGFHRVTQPRALSRGEIAALVTPLLAQEAAFSIRCADPFLIDDRCPASADGQHQPAVSCGDLVCRHYSKVFWL